MNTPSASPPRPPVLLGVCAVFLYLAGSLALVLAALRAGASDSFPVALERASGAVGIGLLLIGFGIVLQLLRDRHEPRPVGPHTFSWGPVAGAMAVLLLPLAAAWTQFELFRDEIWMAPVLSIGGGIYLGMALGRRFGGSRHARTATMVLVSVLGLPLAILSFGLPTQHFRRHGSAVSYVVARTRYDQRAYTFEADLPQAPTAETAGAGSGTLGLVGALAEAKTVETKTVDGVLLVKGEDGVFHPAETTSMEALFEEAEAEDEAERAAQLETYQRALEAHEREVERLRRSGRLFSAP